MNTLADKKVSFEEAMEQLESIVLQLENGDVALEKSIELFQEGMKLSGLCSQKLEQVEKKIETLIEEDGTIKKKDFQLPEDDKGDSA
jgi:exodeoxyribonuclease VII small subunit